MRQRVQTSTGAGRVDMDHLNKARDTAHYLTAAALIATMISIGIAAAVFGAAVLLPAVETIIF